MPRNRRPTVKKISVKATVQQLEGREPSYPVYRFGKTLKYERPERPGRTYRWLEDN